MKALISGASGFIGSALIAELNAQGIEAFALMRRSSSVSNLEGLKFQKVEGDLADAESLTRAVQGMDYVFHLAGVTAAPTRERYFEQNEGGTRRMAEAVAAGAQGIRRFVFVSSLAAGGPAESMRPREESDPDRPVSSYGESKLAAEKALLKEKSRFPIAIVRPPMVYGPRDKGVYLVIRSVARGFAPVIRGHGPGGQKYYSAIHVRDLCRGLVQAALAPREGFASGDVFYLTGPGVHPYSDLIAAMSGALGRKTLRFPVPETVLRAGAVLGSWAGRFSHKTFPLNLDKLNEILPDYWICSGEKAKAALGFSPQYELNRGMKETIDWYREHRWI